MIQLPFPVIKSAIPSQLQPDTLPIADRDRWRNRVTSMLRVPLIQSEERGLGHNTIPIHHGSKAITRHNRNRKWNSLSRTYRGGGHGECHRGKLTPTFSGSASWWWHKKKIWWLCWQKTSTQTYDGGFGDNYLSVCTVRLGSCDQCGEQAKKAISPALPNMGGY